MCCRCCWHGCELEDFKNSYWYWRYIILFFFFFVHINKVQAANSIKNDLTLTQSGLDIDGTDKTKETQPHTSPPHHGHCGLALSKAGNSTTALDSPLYWDGPFSCSHLFPEKELKVYCQDVVNMCWIWRNSQVQYNYLYIFLMLWLSKYVWVEEWAAIKRVLATVCPFRLNLFFTAGCNDISVSCGSVLKISGKLNFEISSASYLDMRLVFSYHLKQEIIFYDCIIV